MPSFSDWLKAIQLKPRLLFGLWLIGMLFLFFPDRLAEKFGFHQIRDSYRGWGGLGTIVAFAFWLVQLIPSWRQAVANRRAKRQVIESMDSLSPDEWFILAFCVDRNQRTITLEIDHRAAGALVAKGLLGTPAGVFNTLAFPYTIPSFVWRHLQKHRRQLLPDDELKQSKVQDRFAELDRHIHRYDDI
jgi:hypothetical protein